MFAFRTPHGLCGTICYDRWVAPLSLLLDIIFIQTCNKDNTSVLALCIHQTNLRQALMTVIALVLVLGYNSYIELCKNPTAIVFSNS